MEISLLIAKQILAMLIMACFGFTAVRLGLLKADHSRILSIIIIYIVTPCVSLSAFQVELTETRIHGMLIALIGSIIIHAIYIAVAYFLGKWRGISDVTKASLIFANAGNLIIPLVRATLGAEMTIYTCVFMLVQTIITWTYGVMLISGEKKTSWKKVFLNINIIAILAGLALFIFQIRIPAMLENSVESVAGIIGPLSMLMIGTLVGGMNLAEIFRDKSNYLYCLTKLILFPVIVILALKVTGLMNADPERILLIPILAAAAPSAVNVTNIAQLYKRSVDKAASLNVSSTILCVATIPLMVWLYELVAVF